MNQSWLIIADDLTGAADSAIAFARRGLQTRILPHTARQAGQNAAVISVDADTRRLSALDAAARHREAVQKFAAPGCSVFKKIDSTLRGNPAVEIAAVMDALTHYGRPAFGVLAPAFPAMGRTTRKGRVFVHGKPLEEGETWRREHAYPNANLWDILESADIAPATLSLADVRAGEAALCEELRGISRRKWRSTSRGCVAICDAEEDADLDCIAKAAQLAAEKPLLVGTAGLAHAVARGLAREARQPVRLGHSNNGALIVVGSLASISRQAAMKLADMDKVVHRRIRPETLLDPERADLRRTADADAREALLAGYDVLVEILAEDEPDLSRGPQLAAALAKSLGGAMANMSGLIVTGGETAAALLGEYHVEAIDLVEEVEPGVCLGVGRGLSQFPLVTKAGAFGDSLSLVRALERLRSIRGAGVLE